MGHTDESGVTLPPLHPRCRCAIIYNEVAAPKLPKPQPKPTTNPSSLPTSPLTPAGAAVATEIISPPEQTKPVVDETAIRAKLEAAKSELKIKGELIYPPPVIDISDYDFDAAHTQGDEHPHDVNEEEARKFIATAGFAIVKYNGNSVNYFSKEGAAYVRKDLKTIRTAFRAKEYDEKIQRLMEVLENEDRDSQGGSVVPAN